MKKITKTFVAIMLIAVMSMSSVVAFAMNRRSKANIKICHLSGDKIKHKVTA